MCCKGIFIDLFSTFDRLGLARMFWPDRSHHPLRFILDDVLAMASCHNATIASSMVPRGRFLLVLFYFSTFLSPVSQLLPPAVTFSLSGPSSTVIVLSQLDSRYFRDVAGQASWSLDFTLVKEGEKEPIAESAHSEFYLRSVYLEAELEAGNYIVYVRLDRTLDRNEVSLSFSDDGNVLTYFISRTRRLLRYGKVGSCQGS